MAIIILANVIFFILISSIAVARGLDIKKPSTWLLGLYGFVSGFLIGFVNFDGNDTIYLPAINLASSFHAGVVFAAMVLLSGPIMLRHRRWAEQHKDLAEINADKKIDKLASTLHKGSRGRKPRSPR